MRDSPAYLETTLSHPELVVHVCDDEVGLTGYLVIDTTIAGQSLGGIRMRSKLTLNEVVALARNMTLKLGFIGVLRRGGAKAGIVAAPSLKPPERARIFDAFGRRLAPIIKSGMYSPGPDMGTYDTDVVRVRKAAGQRVKKTPSKANSIPYWTAFGVFVAALEVMDSRRLRIPDCTVAVEGFGKVGTSVAKVFSDACAKVVAVSTERGAIWNPSGLNVNKLIEMKEEVGDDVVHVYPHADKIKKERLLELNVDVLVPCAGPWTINERNVDRIASKIVAPGANIPITIAAQRVLFERDILYLPDFVTNSGGLLSAALRFRRLPYGVIERIFTRDFAKRIHELMEKTNARQISATETATQIAEARFQKMASSVSKRRSRVTWKKVSAHAYKLGLIPRRIVQPLVIRHIKHLLQEE